MKVKNIDNKIVVYLYKSLLNVDNLDKLHQEIKKIFIKLIKIYKLDFFGLNLVHVYQNKYYGNILEIEKVHEQVFNLDIIDLKLIVHKNNNFYLEMDDYLIDDNFDNLIFYNNKYYLNLEKIDNINKYIEFGNIVYNIDF